MKIRVSKLNKEYANKCYIHKHKNIIILFSVL